MDVEECERIVRSVVEHILPPTVSVQCLKWDGDSKTRTARGYFTADPLVKDVENTAHVHCASPPSNNNPTGTIVLIPERVYGGEKEIRELLSHELIHAYDHCELKRDLTQCEELACSEIRAAREAECAGFDTGYFRGAFCRTFGANTDYCELVKRSCVERIAERSTRSVFLEQQSKDCVRAAFDRCYADLRGPGRNADGTMTTGPSSPTTTSTGHSTSAPQELRT